MLDASYLFPKGVCKQMHPSWLQVLQIKARSWVNELICFPTIIILWFLYIIFYFLPFESVISYRIWIILPTRLFYPIFNFFYSLYFIWVFLVKMHTSVPTSQVGCNFPVLSWFWPHVVHELFKNSYFKPYILLPVNQKWLLILGDIFSPEWLEGHIFIQILTWCSSQWFL